MASQPIKIEKTDTYYVREEKNLLHMFESSYSSKEKPYGLPTFEDSQGNIYLGPALLQPTDVFDSFYPKIENVKLLYERG